MNVCNSAKAQSDTSKIIGTWAFTDFEFITPQNDSDMIRKSAQGMVTRFVDGSHFRASKIIKRKEVFVGKGEYRISEDNKYIYQNEEQAEIILLDSENLSLKLPYGVIMNYIRKPSFHKFY